MYYVHMYKITWFSFSTVIVYAEAVHTDWEMGHSFNLDAIITSLSHSNEHSYFPIWYIQAGIKVNMASNLFYSVYSKLK